MRGIVMLLAFTWFLGPLGRRGCWYALLCTLMLVEGSPCRTHEGMGSPMLWTG